MVNTQQSVVIRADALPSIGAGHVMRCLALAQELVRRGRSVVFAGHNLGAEISARVRAEGCAVRLLRGAHPDPLDLEDMSALVDEGGWVVLDGYTFDAPYMHGLTTSGCRLLVLDDMADRGRLPCDVLLNQNMHAGSKTYDLPDSCVRLLGSRYTLLRQEFLDSHTDAGFRHGPLRVLVTLGGADPSGSTEHILEALERLGPTQAEFQLVVGPSNPRVKQIRRMAAASSQTVTVLQSVADMGQRMRQADLAITAAGSTCWELAYMGVPMLIVTVAANQDGIASELQDAGCAVDLGRVEQLDAANVQQALRELLGDAERRLAMADTGKALVDGMGARRVVEVMEALEAGRLDAAPLLRRAESGDCRAVWEISNDPLVRASSFTNAAIPWEDHVNWFESLLNAKDRVLYLADVGGTVAGQVRFERKQGRGVVSFSVAAPYRGRKLGESLLVAGAKRARQDLGVGRVVGFVKKGNDASERCFLRAGFVKTKNRPQVQGKSCAEFELQSS